MLCPNRYLLNRIARLRGACDAFLGRKVGEKLRSVSFSGSGSPCLALAFYSFSNGLVSHCAYDEDTQKPALSAESNYQKFISNLSTSSLFSKALVLKFLKFNVAIELYRGICFLSEFRLLSLPLCSFVRATILRQFTFSSFETGLLEKLEVYRTFRIRFIVHYCGEHFVQNPKNISEDVLFRHNSGFFINHLSSKNGVPFVSVNLKAFVSEHLLTRMSEIIQNNGILEDMSQRKLAKTKFFSMATVALQKMFRMASKIHPLDDDELSSLSLALHRLNTICDVAERNQVGIIFDETNDETVKVAADYLVSQLSRKFNISEPVVYKSFTIDSEEDKAAFFLEATACLAENLKFGAYIRCCVNAHNFQKDASPFHAVSTFLLERLGHVAVIFSTHEEDILDDLEEKMNSFNIPPNHPRVWFAQIYGAGDAVSLKKAQQDYNVLKIVPVGSLSARVFHLKELLSLNRHAFRNVSDESDCMCAEFKKRMNSFYPF